MKLAVVNYKNIKSSIGMISLDYFNFESMILKNKDILLLVTDQSHERLHTDKMTFHLNYDYAYSIMDGVVFNRKGCAVDYANDTKSAEKVVLRKEQIPYENVEYFPKREEPQHFDVKRKIKQ